jgi:uncharacterized protein YecE (DUF72 family)
MAAAFGRGKAQAVRGQARTDVRPRSIQDVSESPRMYYSAYDDAALRSLADGLAATSSARSPGWCLFDNTAHGHAMADAARLQDLVAAACGSTSAKIGPE